MNANTEVRVVVLNAGVSDPSSTRLLTERLSARLHDTLSADDVTVRTSTVDLGPLAEDVARVLVGGPRSAAVTAAVEAIADADVLIAGTPIYKAGISGLLKSFLDVLDNDLLVGKVVLLAATAGSARHAMVVDDHLRPLFAFMRTVTVPTSVFAAPEDWADPALSKRLARAAAEAAALLRAGLEETVRSTTWDSYQHAFDSTAARRAGAPADLDFDTPLMRLAAGGIAQPPASVSS